MTPAVVVASGHMVDATDRATSRFPAGEVARVTREVRSVVAAWGVGPGTTVVSGGARGADIIVAEECLARGASLVLCLALPEADFESRSVDLPGSDWLDRFRALLTVADVRVLPDADTSDDSVFEQNNQRMVAVAKALGKGWPPHAIIVWNGQAGDGRGGTLDFVKRLGHEGPAPSIRVIDPTPRRYAARENSEGAKKLLSLDGGGIRGVLTLQILGSVEAQLRAYYGRPDTVLSDYFDYFGGTSTGAILAAALASGMDVAELQSKYRELGAIVFKRRFLPMRIRSLYRDEPLTAQLEEVIGAGRTLGDPELRSLLLVVMHNTKTDSPWPLSNCTNAKYNRADRSLIAPSDRNLDLPLTTVLRGSTAAPIYFPPQQIPVGAREFLFQDGGITPFNNPALLMFMMATLPEYGLQWPVGEDRMLIVSVGTGSSAATHPHLRAGQVNFLFNAANLPSVFMNGASLSQDFLCRTLGRCKFGEPIDREIGARLNSTGVSGHNLFTYLRLDADLSDEALANSGIRSRRERAALRKLDAVKQIPQLERLGQAVGAKVVVENHFQGFL